MMKVIREVFNVLTSKSVLRIDPASNAEANRELPFGIKLHLFLNGSVLWGAVAISIASIMVASSIRSSAIRTSALLLLDKQIAKGDTSDFATLPILYLKREPSNPMLIDAFELNALE
ncbi:MAG: hypothetical protein ACKO3V_03090, partial [Pirellula sp.]